MIRSNKNWLLIICFIFSWSYGVGQDIFNAANSKKFAKYLFSTQQYNLAANEYERIISILPNDTNSYINLLASYRLGNICNQSFHNLERIHISSYFNNEQIVSGYLKLALTCNCCYEQTKFKLAMESLDQCKQTFFKAGQITFAENKDSLIKYFNANGNSLQSCYPDIYSSIQNIENFRRKKPFVAAAMSSIIPGSGKAYSGYWGDALMSLVFVSTNAWLSYQGFEKKGVKSVNGWIFGSISMGFYLGNIWGSGRAAKTYNQREYEKIYNEAKNSFYNHF